MPPIFEKPTTDKYDYIVIGGGSGGSGTAVSCCGSLRFVFASNDLSSVSFLDFRVEESCVVREESRCGRSYRTSRRNMCERRYVRIYSTFSTPAHLVSRI